MLCERGPIPLLPKRAPMRSWTATLESSDRYRGPVDDRGTNFHQLASRTRAHPLTTMWLPSGSPGPRAGACLGQSTEGKTVTCKKMLCNQHIINTLLYRHGVLQDTWEPGRKCPCLRRRRLTEATSSQKICKTHQPSKCKSQPKQVPTDSGQSLLRLGRKAVSAETLTCGNPGQAFAVHEQHATSQSC